MTELLKGIEVMDNVGPKLTGLLCLFSIFFLAFQ